MVIVFCIACSVFQVFQSFSTFQDPGLYSLYVALSTWVRLNQTGLSAQKERTFQNDSRCFSSAIWSWLGFVSGRGKPKIKSVMSFN